jgi:hypothetical protein
MFLFAKVHFQRTPGGTHEKAKHCSTLATWKSAFEASRATEAHVQPLINFSPGAHPASCTMGTGSFREGGLECGRGVTLTPSSAEVQKQSRAIPILSLRAFVAYKKGETYLVISITKQNYEFTLLNNHASRCFGSIRSPSSGLSKCICDSWLRRIQIPFATHILVGRVAQSV